MTKKDAKVKKDAPAPAPAVRMYAPARQALEAVDCPTCGALAGQACVGRPNAQWPTGYPWPKSKVHTARMNAFKEL